MFLSTSYCIFFLIAIATSQTKNTAWRSQTSEVVQTRHIVSCYRFNQAWKNIHTEERWFPKIRLRCCGKLWRNAKPPKVIKIHYTGLPFCFYIKVFSKIPQCWQLVGASYLLTEWDTPISQRSWWRVVLGQIIWEMVKVQNKSPSGASV